ncbi:endosome-associated-trafficking regulator 1 isoform X3 [Varanus komodoensis]|uniref:endosome-associated-trafficking regulator 1 isoform X3 n=1 Tax=Varanus komodoensis TaxID=61221 RepID=UPI001CF7CF9E|nr:endosome-associated-trafficking regulator 1 isoform X3 [Varanus komodoensis]
MAGPGRLPTGAERAWGAPAVGPPSCSGEEANPFSFKEFVRSKNQAATTSTLPGAQRTSELLRELRLTSGISPQESSGFSPLDNSSLSPQSFGLSLDLREPFFPDPTVTNSLLDDEEDDWSTTYQPLAVEEAHSTRGPSASLSSTSDSLYSNRSDVSDLGSFSAWQLGGNGSQPQGPLGKGDPSSPQDGVATGDGFLPSPQLSYEELKQENSKLRSMIAHIETVSETQTARVKLLERTLEESKRKEEKEARDLEAMVQQVEENLQLMTKRAVKAESSVIKLKQENVLLQAAPPKFPPLQGLTYRQSLTHHICSLLAGVLLTTKACWELLWFRKGMKSTQAFVSCTSTPTHTTGILQLWCTTILIVPWQHSHWSLWSLVSE